MLRSPLYFWIVDCPPVAFDEVFGSTPVSDTSPA
jgi:hypothetical protein